MGKISRRKGIAILVLSLCLTGLVTAGVLEIAVRVFWPQQEAMRWLTPDARYGHLMKPSYHMRYPFVGSGFVMDIQINSSGFRDEPVVPKQEGVKTVLFIGDSFTFGHGINVEDRFDTIVERLLAQSGTPFRFINTGTNAWGTIQSTRFTADHFDQLAPDIIVLTVCGNDPSDDAYFLEKGQSFDEVRFPGKVFLRHHSHLFRLMTHQAFVLLHNFYLKRQQSQQPDAPVDPQSATLQTDERWAATLDTIRNFHGAFLNYNSRGVLLVTATDPLSPTMREKLSSLDNGSNLRYIDLHDPVNALLPEERHLPYDGHWSLKMHVLVAEHLAPAIEAATGPP